MAQQWTEVAEWAFAFTLKELRLIAQGCEQSEGQGRTTAFYPNGGMALAQGDRGMRLVHRFECGAELFNESPSPDCLPARRGSKRDLVVPEKWILFHAGRKNGVSHTDVCSCLKTVMETLAIQELARCDNLKSGCRELESHAGNGNGKVSNVDDIDPYNERAGHG